jgi:hypothetical protein
MDYYFDGMVYFQRRMLFIRRMGFLTDSLNF